ncbi:tetratricopeptide repeat protein [Myxosarcina sp. GI1(2024)]
MQIDYQNCARFQPKQGSLLSTYSSNEVSVCLYSSLAYGEKLNSEARLKTCLEEITARGDYAVAIAILDELIALRPDSAVNYNNRGLMHFHNNQTIEAIVDLSLALKLDPKLDSAYNNRANCYAAQGNLAEAIADYDLALDLNPTNLRAWINQGITFRELEMYDSAIENFDLTLIIGNSFQERIYAERGRCYHLRGDWNCAVADYQKSLQLLKDDIRQDRYREKVTVWLETLYNPLRG